MTDTERNQLLSREVNEHIRARFGGPEDPMTPFEILCECGGCDLLVATTLAEYDARRGAGYLTAH